MALVRELEDLEEVKTRLVLFIILKAKPTLKPIPQLRNKSPEQETPASTPAQEFFYTRIYNQCFLDIYVDNYILTCIHMLFLIALIA